MLSEDATDASFIVFRFIWSKLEPASDYTSDHSQGRIQGKGDAPGARPRSNLKKLRRAEGGAKIFGIFRVKNHDFTPKNHIF
jgi:hypothetical protein